MKRMARIIKITATPTPIPIHVPVSDGRDEDKHYIITCHRIA
jgi:hypothetical protein